MTSHEQKPAICAFNLIGIQKRYPPLELQSCYNTALVQSDNKNLKSLVNNFKLPVLWVPKQFHEILGLGLFSCIWNSGVLDTFLWQCLLNNYYILPVDCFLVAIFCPVNLFPFLCMLSMFLIDSIVNSSLKVVIARKHGAATCEHWILYGCNPAVFRYQVFMEAHSISGHNSFLRSMDTDKDTRHMGRRFSKD